MQLDNERKFTDPQVSPSNPRKQDLKKKWYVWFRFFDADTGKVKQFRFIKGINQYDTLAERVLEANALKETLKEELQNGWSPIDGYPERFFDNPIVIYSLQEAIDYVLKIKEQTLRKKSMYAYKYITALFLDWLTANNMNYLQVKAFTNQKAQQYMDWMLMKKKYSGRTFNDHLIVLRTFFNCFMDRDWCTKNPFRSVKRKSQVVGRNQAYTESEKSLLDKTLYDRDRRMYFFTQIMFHCFIRRTELTMLKVKHIDLLNRTITIPGEGAKNKHQESVVIPKGLEPVLREMELHNYASEDFVFGRKMLTGPKQFSNPNHISTRHNDIVKELGIDLQKGLYSHKHSGVCAYYYATGKDLYALLRQLRHRDLSTTQIYLKSLGLVDNVTFRDVMVA